MVYCYGKGCALHSTCKRYVEGQRVMNNSDIEEDRFVFIGNCDPEARELFISTEHQ